MIKFTILLRRTPAMTHDEFVDYHRHRHAPSFMSIPVVQKHVRRYVQTHAIAADLPGLPITDIDGTTELWFADEAALAAVFTDLTYLEVVRPDEARFLDLEHCEFLVTQDNVVYAGAPAA